MGQLLNLNMDTSKSFIKMASETITQYFENVDDLCWNTITPSEQTWRLENGAKQYNEWYTDYERIHNIESYDGATGYAIDRGVDELNRLSDRVENITPKLRNHIYKLCNLFTCGALNFDYYGKTITEHEMQRYLHIPHHYIWQFTSYVDVPARLPLNTATIDFHGLIKTSNKHLFIFFELA
jgi:hypothetical protein